MANVGAVGGSSFVLGGLVPLSIHCLDFMPDKKIKFIIMQQIRFFNGLQPTKRGNICTSKEVYWILTKN